MPKLPTHSQPQASTRTCQPGRAPARFQPQIALVLLALVLITQFHAGHAQQLTARGPWLIYTTVDGLAAANTDGTGRTLIAAARSDGSAYHVTPSPAGGNFTLSAQRLALIPGQAAQAHADLRLVDMATGATRMILNSRLPHDIATHMNAGYIVSALDSADGLPAWAPGGDRFAFLSAHQGQPDVYLHHIHTGITSRLTNTTAFPHTMVWSPNGRRLLWEERAHRGTTTNATVMMASFASASHHTQDAAPVVLPLGLPSEQGWAFVGWDTPERFFYTSRDANGDTLGLYVYDFTTGTATTLLPPLTAALPPAYAPASDILILPVADSRPGWPAGLYQIDTSHGERHYLLPVPGELQAATWNPALDSFVITTSSENLLLRIDSSGPSHTLLGDGNIHAAPDGSSIAYHQPGNEITIAPGAAAPRRPIWLGEASPPLWSTDGQRVYTIVTDATTPGLLMFDRDAGPPTRLDPTAQPGVLALLMPADGAVFSDYGIPLYGRPAADATIIDALYGDETIATILARSQDGTMLAIQLADGRGGWVQHAQVSYSGDLSDLAVRSQ